MRVGPASAEFEGLPKKDMVAVPEKKGYGYLKETTQPHHEQEDNMSSSSSALGISPSSSATMSSSDAQRADQIAFHFYTKLFYVVNHARTTNPLPAKLDKWFNLETPDSDLFTKEDRERYKSISSSPPPPLEIQVLLTVPELTNNQVLVHLPPESSRVRIHPTPRFVLLETFVLDFVPGPPVDVPLPTIYKHGIPLFRSLYTLLRVLPAWKLHKRLRRRATASLGITLRVRSGHDPDILILTNAESLSHTFPSLPHPMGSFTLSMTYLAHPTFQLDELESLLSSRFLSLDQRPFTPTLAKTSGASSTSPPRSPPRQPSSLPRSLLGRQSITAAGAAMQAPPTPPTRAQALRQLPDSSTSSLSPSNSFYTPAPPPASASATGGGDTQPQTRPTPRYPFPFKSNTVSSTAFPSSSSHGSVTALPSSLSERSNLSERIAQYERERVASFPHHPSDLGLSGSHSPSQSPLQRPVPLPLHARQTSLSVSRPTPLRDSPGTGDDPNASVSASASTSASASGARKRYSSSFGHRYTGPTPSPSTSSPAQQPQPQPQSQQRPGHTPSPSASSPLQPQRSQRPSPVQLGGTGLGLLGLNSSPSPSPSSPHFTNRPVLAPSPGGVHAGTGASPSSPLYPIPRPPENRRSSIGMEVKTDEEDISIFVREIETRKPLIGRSRTGTPSASGEMISHSRSQSQPHSQLGPQWQSQSHALSEAQHGRSESGNGGSSGGQSGSGNFETRSPLRQSGAQVEADAETEETNLPQPQAQLEASRSPPSGLILTSEAEVDARLQRMNEAFLRSLQGLGGTGTGMGTGGSENGRRERSQSQSQSQSQSRNQIQSQSHSQSGSGSGTHSRGSRFSTSGGLDRERDRERDQVRERLGIVETTPLTAGVGVGAGVGVSGNERDPWIGQPPGMLVRQGSQEVVGGMELPLSSVYGGGGANVDAGRDHEFTSDSPSTRPRGVGLGVRDRPLPRGGGGSGGRFVL